MSQRSMKEQVVTQLRSTNEPALSAQQLAEKLDVSVPTINNHTETLVGEGRIDTTQIGNATAYYISNDSTQRDGPEHTCKKCGRLTARHDFAKLDTTTYFERRNEENSMADFVILCRFCYSDFISWAWNDPGSMGMYPHVHSWYIPDDQLEEVREDPEIETAPGREFLDEEPTAVMGLIEEHCADPDEGLTEDEIVELAREEVGLSRIRAQSVFQNLRQGGHLRKRTRTLDIVYDPAK